MCYNFYLNRERRKKLQSGENFLFRLPLREQVKSRWRDEGERERERGGGEEKQWAKESLSPLLPSELAMSKPGIPGLLFASHWI